MDLIFSPLASDLPLLILMPPALPLHSYEIIFVSLSPAVPCLIWSLLSDAWVSFLIRPHATWLRLHTVAQGPSPQNT